MLSSILRIGAIVMVSAVSVISSVLKEKNDPFGPINLKLSSYNNSNPYNSNTGEMNMYNNAYGSQSRRFYGCAQPSYPMAPVPPMGQFQQPMRPLTFGSPYPQFQAPALSQNGYSVPCYNANNNYGYQPTMYSRRNMLPGGYVQPQLPQQQTQTINPLLVQNMMGTYREPTYGQYGYGYGYDNGVSALYSNNYSAYNYGYADNNTYGGYQQPQQNMWQQQPQTLAGYNNSDIIGSAARFKYWCPPSSNNSGSYYGYDDSYPSYPTTQSYNPQPQPMMRQPQQQSVYPAYQAYQQQSQQSMMPQYTDERTRLYDEIERFREQQRHASSMKAMNALGRMNDPMDGRLHNTGSQLNTDNAWSMGNGYNTPNPTPAPAQPTPPPPTTSAPYIAPIPPFMQNGPARFQEPHHENTSLGGQVSIDAIFANGSPSEPAPPPPVDPTNIVMQFGDNWVPPEQQAEAYAQPTAPPSQPQPQTAVGIQPLYTIPNEQTQIPPAPPAPTPPPQARVAKPPIKL